MAGTDKTKIPASGGPAIILVEPQLGENIGMTARAMANFGLSRLRLVAPRDGWPSEAARKAASGADWVIEGVKVHDTLEAAIADLGLVYATTARDRDMTKPVVGPKTSVDAILTRQMSGEDAGVLFGRERWGLTNEEIALADEILTYPVNPAFASLNIAQAVLLFGYEWFVGFHAAETGEDEGPERTGGAALAEKAELFNLFEHLETELDEGGFLKPVEKRPKMVQNLRNILHRASLTSQDVRTLRGVIVALTGRPFRGKGGPGTSNARDENV